MFIIWNKKSLTTFLASIIWNSSEFFMMPLGKKTALIVFELVTGLNKRK